MGAAITRSTLWEHIKTDIDVSLLLAVVAVRDPSKS